MLVSVGLVSTGCERKKSKRSEPTSQTNPPPKPADEKEKKEQKDGTKPTNGTATGNTSNPNTTAMNTPAPLPAPRVGQPNDSVITRSDLPPPVTAQPPEEQLAVVPQIEPAVAKLEAALPKARLLDTFGGQLIQSYLSGEVTGEQVIQQVFDDDNLVMSNLAEMSAGVHTLRSEGKYTPDDREKVLVLEGALTQHLNDKVERGEVMARTIEYGTALALGVGAGVYSNEILHALRRLWSSTVVQAPIRGVQNTFSWAASLPGAAASALKGRFGEPASQVAQAGKKQVDDVVGKSTDLYRRALGWATTPADPQARSAKVFNNIYRVINSPHLAKGYRVNPIIDDELKTVKRWVYTRTGIPGFRINHHPGREYIVAQLVVRGGDYEYYRVVGSGIKALTKDGEEVIQPAVMTGLIASRLKNLGDNTATFMSNAGGRIATGVKESRPYKYATVDPFGRRLVQGAAVGVPVSALTLLAMSPLDTTRLTLDDYVRDLDSEGINVDRFIEVQRKKATAGRM
jgi:hypothetical protein